MNTISSKDAFQKAKKNGPMLIDFYTTWCAPCKIQAAELEEHHDNIKKLFPYLGIYKINIESDPFFGKMADKLGIRSIPQLGLFNGNGKIHMMSPGVKRTNDITKFLKEYLG